VKDALEQLVCKESLQGYTCTKSKVEVRLSLLFGFIIVMSVEKIAHCVPNHQNANHCNCNLNS